MIKDKTAWMMAAASWLAFAFSTPAQTPTVLVPGLYEIVTGEYTECCGLFGDIHYQLPLARQALVRLSIDPLKGAKLVFLESDAQTAFKVFPCPPGTPTDFVLGHGLVSSNTIVFQTDPGPPPNQVYCSYMISNASNGLRLEGTFGTTARMCPGIPDTFYHTNVLARLLPAPPVIHAMRRESDAIRFEFAAEAPYDYSVEFCDAFCATDWHSLTNFHATLGTGDALVVDATTNSPARFYRIRKQLRM
jgi:hypothetical protein